MAILESSATEVKTGDAATKLEEADGNAPTDAEAEATATTN